MSTTSGLRSGTEGFGNFRSGCAAWCSWCWRAEIVGNQTTRPPIFSATSTADGLSPPTIEFRTMLPKTCVFTPARRGAIARTSITVGW
jgi:hypothetical protein